MAHMRSVLLALLLMVLAAGAAQATHFQGEPVPAADCVGWQVDGFIYFGSVNIDPATLVYAIELLQDGGVVASAGGELIVSTPGPRTAVPFSVGDVWGLDLCGTYTVTVDLEIVHPTSEPPNTFHSSTELVCDCPPPPPEGCYRTPGYWKNHADAWLETTLVVGGVEYGQDDLLAILDAPVRGDATVILFKHLVAAMLNRLAGGDDGIDPTIDDAHAFLMAHALFSRPAGEDKDEALMLKDALMEYNEQGCDDGMDDMDAMKALGAVRLDKSAAAQRQSWSSVKETYR